MLKSEPNAKCCLWKPFLSKITLKNESNFKVKYEAYPYKGGAIGKIDAAIGAGGFEGKAALDIIQAENIKPEVGIIPRNDSRHVTVSGSQKVAIRYMYLDLHDDYTEEVRNFGVLDLVKFVQPSQEDIDEILRIKKEMIVKIDRVQVEAKRKEEQEKKEREAFEHRCSSVAQFMCTPSDMPKKLCPYCKHWYCNYHYKVNHGPVGGGHVCN